MSANLDTYISDRVAQLDARISAVSERRAQYVRILPDAFAVADNTADELLDILLDYDETLSELTRQRDELLEPCWR